jgi:hypothetical protein
MKAELRHTFEVSIYFINLEVEVTPFVFGSYIFGRQEKLSPSLGVDEDLAPHLARVLFEMLVDRPYSNQKAVISNKHANTELRASKLNTKN